MFCCNYGSHALRYPPPPKKKKFSVLILTNCVFSTNFLTMSNVTIVFFDQLKGYSKKEFFNFHSDIMYFSFSVFFYKCIIFDGFYFIHNKLLFRHNFTYVMSFLINNRL